MSRRRVVASGLGALGLAACGGDDPPSTPSPVPIPTSAITPPPPTPTQAAIASPVAGYLDPDLWSGRSISVASPALGTTLDTLSSAFLDAFARATGAVVRHQELGRDGIASLRDQVENDETVWDVVLLPTANVLPLSQSGYLAAIDYNVVDTTALYQELLMQHGVGARMYSTVIVYPIQAETVPTGWTEFWDLRAFGGTRALRRDPVGTLEFATLASGVMLPDLFPLDTAAAFASLERIRAATLFYEDSKQPVELVRSTQVGLASAWNVRTSLPDVGPAVSVQWDGAMISADSWVIPKGSANLDVAMSFLNFATRAVPTANYSTLENFGPVNKDAIALLREDIVDSLPNAPGRVERQFFENWGFWAEFREPVTEQFESWLLNPAASPAVPS